jgi:hypothetical protein
MSLMLYDGAIRPRAASFRMLSSPLCGMYLIPAASGCMIDVRLSFGGSSNNLQLD